MMIIRKTTAIDLMLTAFLLLLATAAWAETAEYDGLIQPYAVVDIGAPTEGIVVKVAVDRSSPVKPGQTLAVMESSVERAALERAKAMASFDGEIGLQQTKLAFAKRAHNRVKTLDVIPDLEKDQIATEILLTRYRLKKAREKRALAQLELKKAQAVLARRSIRSPISGVVVERYVTPGEYVNSQPLLQLAQIDPLRVEVVVPARMFGKISSGTTATIVPELPEYGAQKATVTIVDKVIDSASNTFGVRLELPNAEHRIASGLKCLVRFDLTEK